MLHHVGSGSRPASETFSGFETIFPNLDLVFLLEKFKNLPILVFNVHLVLALLGLIQAVRNVHS
jgi:hypothetical protein